MKKPEPVEADYYEVRFLKKSEQHGVWEPMVQCFPTKADADEHAAQLALGRQASIKIIPRQWG